MKRQGFTLVELVVVILILGILAGVAAPRFLNTSGDATEASVRQTLSVVRDAIELFTAQNNGALPLSPEDPTGAATLDDALEPYLRGGVPASPVGLGDRSVNVLNSGTGATGGDPATSDWIYNSADGTFVNGFSGDIPSDTTGATGYDDL